MWKSVYVGVYQLLTWSYYLITKWTLVKLRLALERQVVKHKCINPSACQGKTRSAWTKIEIVYWLMGKRSALSIHNKLMLYKQILKPVWTYGIQLWWCTKQSNIDIIQRFKNKVFRNIFDAPWYIRNVDFHRDFQKEMVTN